MAFECEISLYDLSTKLRWGGFWLGTIGITCLSESRGRSTYAKAKVRLALSLCLSLCCRESKQARYKASPFPLQWLCRWGMIPCHSQSQTPYTIHRGLAIGDSERVSLEREWDWERVSRERDDLTSERELQERWPMLSRSYRIHRWLGIALC